ncbi:MAG: DUF72 domain-containing protein [bacterium]
MEGRDWRVGCAGFPVSREKYFAALDLVELQDTFYDPPTERALGRMRRGAPEGFVFALKAWQLITHPPSFQGYARIRRRWDRGLGARFGHFQAGEDVRWAWSVLRAAAEALRAGAILFQTPPTFTPTAENRKHMAGFFAEIERGPWRLVWEPQGVWDDQDVEEICHRLGLVPAVDPLVSRPMPGEFFYCRLRRPKHRRPGYTEDDFARISDRVLSQERPGGAQHGHFIFDSPASFRDAERFRRWLAEQDRVNGSA